MSDEMLLKTELKYEGGSAVSLSESRPGIRMVGLTEMADNPEAWTPPHAYVASVESCFLLTMLAIARKMRIGIRSYSSEAEGRLTSADGSHKEVPEISIRVRVNLEDESAKPKLPRLMQMAEEHCLVARSIKTKVSIES